MANKDILILSTGSFERYFNHPPLPLSHPLHAVLERDREYFESLLDPSNWELALMKRFQAGPTTVGPGISIYEVKKASQRDREDFAAAETVMQDSNLSKSVCMLVMNAMDVMDDPRVYRQATTMAQAGYNVVVIGRSLSTDDPLCERSHGVTVIRVRNLLPKLFITREKALGVLKEGEFLIRALIANLQIALKAIRLRADIYHAHEIGALPVGYALKRLTGARLVYDAHELYTESSSMQKASGWFRGLFEAVQSYILPKVDAITTVGETVAQEMYRRYKCARPVILRNCPRWEQTDATQRNALREALGLTEDQKIVLFQGAYAPYRGLEQIVESTRFVHEDGVIVLRGWGKMESELRALAQELRISDRIFFVEPVAAREVVNAAIGADIGVMAYLPEVLNYKYASPNKIFEYMMAGLAIAASDLPEIRRIIEETGSGVLFDPYDPKSIASAINRLISDEELLRSAQRNSRRAAREKYNWEKEGQKLLNLYETLLAHG